VCFCFFSGAHFRLRTCTLTDPQHPSYTLFSYVLVSFDVATHAGHSPAAHSCSPGIVTYVTRARVWLGFPYLGVDSINITTRFHCIIILRYCTCNIPDRADHPTTRHMHQFTHHFSHIMVQFLTVLMGVSAFFRAHISACVRVRLPTPSIRAIHYFHTY